MFTPKFTAQIDRIGDLYSTPIRYNILFFTKIAASRKNRDVMRVLEKLEIGQLPKIDRRFRVCLAGISEEKKWQILEGGSRKVVDAITPEFALLSEGEIPNLEAIREHYDADYYPWSAALTSLGATTFDPEAFEKINRQSLKKAQVIN